MPRRDEQGKVWSKAEVQREVFAIVAAKAGVPADTVYADTRFGEGGLGWDAWYRLSVIRPVQQRLHETLAHAIVKNELETVGQLITYIWSLMEEI
jgi:acyl carrier protein